MIEKKAVLFDLTSEELAKQISHYMTPIFQEKINQVLKVKQEDESRPLSLAEGAEYLNVGTTTFSKFINSGEIKFSSKNPSNPRAKKFVMIKDLREWLEANKTRSIKEIKEAANGNI